MELIQNQAKNEQLAEEAVTRLNLANDDERITAYNIILDVINRSNDDCNVAIEEVAIPLKKSPFDAAYADTKAQTVDLDAKILRDFEQLRAGPNSNRRYKLGDLILGLMEWYERPNLQRLNLIFQSDAIADNPEAQQYIKFAAVKAHQLRHRQSFFRSVNIRHDAATNRLGIFCDVKDYRDSATFMGSIIRQLKLTGKPVVMDIKDLPDGYQRNFPLLKQYLKRKFYNHEVLVINRGDSVIISLR
jgi:hypothetical protein